MLIKLKYYHSPSVFSASLSMLWMVFIIIRLSAHTLMHYLIVINGILAMYNKFIKLNINNLSHCCHIKSILSNIVHTIYMAVCIQLTYFCCDDFESTCTSSYYYHQIVSMRHLQLFKVRSWNNSMRCMSLHILIKYVDHVYISILNVTSLFRSIMDSKIIVD